METFASPSSVVILTVHMVQCCMMVYRVHQNALRMLSPFVKYVMLEPSGSTGPLRLALCMSDHHAMRELMIECLPSLPVRE